MDRATVAEWLLCQVMSTERASELVGDLLESRSNDGRRSFWIPVVWLMISFSWRTLLGVFLSPLVSISFAALTLVLFVITSGENIYFERDLTTEMYWFGISTLLWEATVLSFVRFKIRSPYFSVTLAASVSFTVATYFLYAAHRLSILTLVGGIFLVFCASHRLRLRALGALLGTLTVSWLTAYGLSKIGHDPRSVFGAWSGWMVLLVVPFVANSSTFFFCGRFLSQGPRHSGLVRHD